MSSTANPYLSFSGNALEAMEFYTSIFGGDLEVMKFGENSFGADPEGVMHASLTTDDGWVLMASDGGDAKAEAGRVSVAIMGGEKQLRGYFEALCEGGEKYMEFEKQMWGDVFGSCKDRFGIEWNINGTPEA